MTYRTAALCAGTGALELGLTLAGIDHTLQWFSEVDPAAEQVMAHHHPDVPNLGDLTQIKDPPPVDIVTAGWPCQPVSSAGARKGTDDDRWIIRDVVSVWRASGARWLILENVSGLLSANDGEAFGQVVDALAEVGASAEWTHLRASDVGAPHRRERWFCVATAADAESLRLERSRRARGRWPRPADSGPLLPTPTCGDANSSGSAGYAKTATHNPGVTLTDATTRGLTEWGTYSDAIDRWEHITRPAADPLVDGKLSPAFVEWMMGLPEGHVTSVPDLSRAQMLKILGNGVVPQQAAAAIRRLFEVTR